MRAKRMLFTSLLLAVAFPCLALASQQAKASQQSNSSQQNNGFNVNKFANRGNKVPAHNKFAGIILPAGSTVHIRLQTTLTSKTNKTGDKFTGYIYEPIKVGDKTIVPAGSLADGHVVFVKKSKRIKGVGQMRIVLDDITTENGDQFLLNGSLDQVQGSPCARASHDSEGTIKGCGKSMKSALKGSAIAGAVGAGAGATVGMGHEIDCAYFGACGGPSFGADLGYGAAAGAGAALIYNLFKHEKALVLLQGTHLTFIVDRSVQATPMPASDNIPQPSSD